MSTDHFRVALNLIMKARQGLLSEAKCKVFVMKISFRSYANKTNFHMKSVALSQWAPNLASLFIVLSQELENGPLSDNQEANNLG